MGDHEYHSGAKPQESLKGGMFDPHTQAPNTSENEGNSRPQSDAGGPGWDAQFRAPQPGMSSSNDKNKAH